VTTAIWTAFGIFLLAVLVSTVWAGYQALRVWRQLRSVPGGVLGQVEEIARRANEAQQRTAALEQQVAELQQRVESLNGSLARARILVNAAGEMRTLVDSARTYIPTK
jgi:TolA-binding protein